MLCKDITDCKSSWLLVHLSEQEIFVVDSCRMFCSLPLHLDKQTSKKHQEFLCMRLSAQSMSESEGGRSPASYAGGCRCDSISTEPRLTPEQSGMYSCFIVSLIQLCRPVWWQLWFSDGWLGFLLLMLNKQQKDI